MRNHALVAQDLLRAKANVDARDAHGRTPLFLAAEGGHSRAARVLARFGANMGAKASDGKTPLDVAKHDEKLQAWLVQFGDKREHTSENAGKIAYFQGLGADLPAHVVAPRLALQSWGYAPLDENGEPIMIRRGIRFAKKRKGPSRPEGHLPVELLQHGDADSLEQCGRFRLCSHLDEKSAGVICDSFKSSLTDINQRICPAVVQTTSNLTLKECQDTLHQVVGMAKQLFACLVTEQTEPGKTKAYGVFSRAKASRRTTVNTVFEKLDASLSSSYNTVMKTNWDSLEVRA